MHKKKYRRIIFAAILCLLFVPSQHVFAQGGKVKEKDYCSLFDVTKGEAGKVFRTKALMSYSKPPAGGNAFSFAYSGKCNNKNYFAVVDFSILANPEKWAGFFDQLPDGKSLIFEVKLAGAIRVSPAPYFGHARWTRTKFRVTEIESIKEITPSVKKPKL